jgi:hypothetical protein
LTLPFRSPGICALRKPEAGSPASGWALREGLRQGYAGFPAHPARER